MTTQQAQAKWKNFQIMFGENMRVARLSSGLKQSDIAARAGITQQRLSIIEAGTQNLTFKTMTTLAEILGRDLPDMQRCIDPCR